MKNILEKLRQRTVTLSNNLTQLRAQKYALDEELAAVHRQLEDNETARRMHEGANAELQLLIGQLSQEAAAAEQLAAGEAKAAESARLEPPPGFEGGGELVETPEDMPVIVPSSELLAKIGSAVRS